MSLSQLQAPRIENNYGSLASSLLSAGSNSTNVSINAQNQAISNMSNAFKTLSDKLYDYNGSKALATANKIDNINDYNRAMEDGTINLNGLRMEDMAKLDQRKNTLIQRENAMLQLGQQQRAVEDEMNARDFEAKNPDAIAHYNELMAKGDLLGAKNYLKELQASGALTAGGYSWIKNKQNILDGLNDFKTLEDIRQGDERLAEQARANRAREEIEAKNLALKEQQLKAKAQQGKFKPAELVKVAKGLLLQTDLNSDTLSKNIEQVAELVSGGDSATKAYLIAKLQEEGYDISTASYGGNPKNNQFEKPSTGAINYLTDIAKRFEKDEKNESAELFIEATKGVTTATSQDDLNNELESSTAKLYNMGKRVDDEVKGKFNFDSSSSVSLLDKDFRDNLSKLDQGDYTALQPIYEKYMGRKLEKDDMKKYDNFVEGVKENTREYNADNPNAKVFPSDIALAMFKNKNDGRLLGHIDEYAQQIHSSRQSSTESMETYDALKKRVDTTQKELEKVKKILESGSRASITLSQSYRKMYAERVEAHLKAVESLKQFKEKL